MLSSIILGNTVLKIFKSHLGQLVLVGTLGLGIGAWAHTRLSSPPSTTQIVHDTKQVIVEVPVLTTKVVDRIVTDPKQQVLINNLLKVNEGLKVQVASVSSSVSTATSTGGTTASDGGTITPLPSTQTSMPNLFEFKDWQLDAKFGSNGVYFDYVLNQTFRVVSTTGRDANGQPVGLVDVYQTGSPKGDVKVPTTTTVVFADGSVPRWLISPRIQAGLGVNQDGVKGGVVALQWLKHGKSKAAEDVRWAVGSPALFVGGGTSQAGVLPISFNFGTIPKVPLTNLWVSPFLDTQKRVGVVLTATF